MGSQDQRQPGGIEDMGARKNKTALLLLAGFLMLGVVESMELAPLSFIPQDIIEFFHPLSAGEGRVLPGAVDSRARRELSDSQAAFMESALEEQPTYRISKTITEEESGEVREENCMFIKTRARFNINFKTRSPSPVNVGSKTYDMPLNPEKVNGTCALLTENSRIFIFWSGFNFTKNPEGNSYYMNRAILVYDTGHPDLKDDFK